MSDLTRTFAVAREWGGGAAWRIVPDGVNASATADLGDMGGDSRASARADWAQALGKGRSQASDGPAWTAAIGEASFGGLIDRQA